MKCWAGWIIGWNQDCQDESQADIIRYADDTTLTAESEEKLNSLQPLDKGERGGWKAGLKLNIQKTKIMASSPITSCQIEEGKVETVTDFIFLGSKITADSDWGHEFERCLLLGRKAMTNLAY